MAATAAEQVAGSVGLAMRVCVRLRFRECVAVPTANWCLERARLPTAAAAGRQTTVTRRRRRRERFCLDTVAAISQYSLVCRSGGESNDRPTVSFYACCGQTRAHGYRDDLSTNVALATRARVARQRRKALIYAPPQ